MLHNNWPPSNTLGFPSDRFKGKQMLGDVHPAKTYFFSGKRWGACDCCILRHLLLASRKSDAPAPPRPIAATKSIKKTINCTHPTTNPHPPFTSSELLNIKTVFRRTRADLTMSTSSKSSRGRLWIDHEGQINNMSFRLLIVLCADS